MTLATRLWFLAPLVLGCMRPAEDRVEQDRGVGQAASSGVEVAVDEGHAAVRALGASELVLWAAAPSLRFSLEFSGSGSQAFEIEIQNAMPRGTLGVEAPAGLSLVELPGTLPTRKRYRIEAPASEMRLAFASADANQRSPFQIALMSDVQEALDRVSDVFQKMNEEPNLDFLLGAGDLTEQGSHQQLQQYQRELEGLAIPYYTTLGNHELGQNPVLYHDYFGRGSQSFEYRGVYFTLLDSASATLDPTVYDWLEVWLDRARDHVHVVGMHIPPLDPIGVRNGSFASRGEASKLLGSLAEAGVDLTVYGHIHSYYEFENAGIPAYISGGGGAIPERFDGIGRHFVVFELSATEGLLSSRTVRVD